MKYDIKLKLKIKPMSRTYANNEILETEDNSVCKL